MISFPAPAFRPRCRSEANILVGRGSWVVRWVGKGAAHSKQASRPVTKSRGNCMQGASSSSPVCLLLAPIGTKAKPGQVGERGSSSPRGSKDTRTTHGSTDAIVRELSADRRQSFSFFTFLFFFFHFSVPFSILYIPYLTLPCFTHPLVFPAVPQRRLLPLQTNTVTFALPGLHWEFETQPSSTRETGI